MKMIIKVLEKDATYDYTKQVISVPDLSRRIESLFITTRASNCLKSAGIKTLEDLTKLRPWDLTHIPNLGKETRYDIISALYMAGYYFTGNLDD